MKFTRTTYPSPTGSPCWKLKSRWLDIDADWNTRFPFGTSFGAHFGPSRRIVHRMRCDREHCSCTATIADGPGFLLDLNAPLGEPNRLYLWLLRWHVTLGLPEVRDFRETGREPLKNGRGTAIHGEWFNNWRHPRIAGVSRYRYHRDDDGEWVRNDKPDPMHWGWLTIERRRVRGEAQ